MLGQVPSRRHFEKETSRSVKDGLKDGMGETFRKRGSLLMSTQSGHKGRVELHVDSKRLSTEVLFNLVSLISQLHDLKQRQHIELMNSLRGWTLCRLSKQRLLIWYLAYFEIALNSSKSNREHSWDSTATSSWQSIHITPDHHVHFLHQHGLPISVFYAGVGL